MTDARASEADDARVVGYIELTPEWESTAEWFARGLAEHAFDKNSREPVISLIEQIRYLTVTDRDAVQRIIERLSR